jgi:hypothetical protein
MDSLIGSEAVDLAATEAVAAEMVAVAGMRAVAVGSM